MTDGPACAALQIDNSTTHLERLRNINVLTDLFFIWHQGPFGTISGLHPLPPRPPFSLAGYLLIPTASTPTPVIMVGKASHNTTKLCQCTQLFGHHTAGT